MNLLILVLAGVVAGYVLRTLYLALLEAWKKTQ